MTDNATSEPALVTITKERYTSLLEDEAQLRHLEALGVDNWEGYSSYTDEDEDE